VTEERLQKVLARAGLGSRRAIEDMIRAGRIVVNGERAILGRRIDVSKDAVEVDGLPVPVRTDLVYYALNKPPGVVTTAADPEGRPTVQDYVDEVRRVWPVGRLDVDTEGLLLLTNDGELTHRLTHPSFGVTKTYLAEIRGDVGGRALKALSRGVPLEDGASAPAHASLVEKVGGSSLVELSIAEGRNREVRRMFEALGYQVTRLVRIAVGPVRLGRLKSGTIRRLSNDDVRALYRAGR